MRTLTVPEWGSVFVGNPKSEKSVRPYRPNVSDMDRWLTLLAMSDTATAVLHATESAAEFFRLETDLALLVPREEWSEFFYSLKNGFVSPNCPAQFLYFAKRIYDTYHICNLIGSMLPREVSLLVCKHNFFGAGYTARDVICNFVNEKFQPITQERLIVRCGEWYEAYIPQTDMVAALPLSIGKLLTPEDLPRIRQIPGVGLTLSDKPLHTLGGYQGTVNSFYDLRGAV